MFKKLNSIGLFGMEAYIVEVEIDISSGLPSFDIVGLPGTSVKESRDRVRSAIKNCGYTFPVSKITVNLAPADIRKEGPIYDLPILLSILKASGQTDAATSESIFVGELSLNGEIRPVNGLLAMAMKAKANGYKQIFVPAINAAEASVVQGIDIYPVETIKQLIRHLQGEEKITPVPPYNIDLNDSFTGSLDFSDVKGQFMAKRAMEIAAAGGHNLLLIGPPGSGKSMLAKRLPSILPRMTFEESISTTKIHSIAGILPSNTPIITSRPFRAPHHTVSPAGLTGGGAIPRPGEVSLAHNGVLFLDELPEFSRSAMEVLRQPLEDERITISRVAGTLSYSCSFMLVAAMNPCPCGYFGHPTRKCICSRTSVAKYLNRVSGPMLDRLDLHVEVPPVDIESLSKDGTAEPSSVICKRVNHAREIQNYRYKNSVISCNARLTPAMEKNVCILSNKAKRMLVSVFDRMGLSARAYDRILKVSRTIADLENSEIIEEHHIAESIQFRSLDRKYWTA